MFYHKIGKRASFKRIGREFNNTNLYYKWIIVWGCWFREVEWWKLWIYQYCEKMFVTNQRFYSSYMARLSNVTELDVMKDDEADIWQIIIASAWIRNNPQEESKYCFFKVLIPKTVLTNKLWFEIIAIKISNKQGEMCIQYLFLIVLILSIGGWKMIRAFDKFMTIYEFLSTYAVLESERPKCLSYAIRLTKNIILETIQYLKINSQFFFHRHEGKKSSFWVLINL